MVDILPPILMQEYLKLKQMLQNVQNVLVYGEDKGNGIEEVIACFIQNEYNAVYEYDCRTIFSETGSGATAAKLNQIFDATTIGKCTTFWTH